VDHETEVALVEAHAERRGGDEGLDLVVQESLFGGGTFGRVGLARVRRHVEAGGAQVVGHLGRGGDGQGVDDARAGELGEVVGQPPQSLGVARKTEHVERERGAVERAALDEHVGLVGTETEHGRDVVDHPGVGGRRGGEHRGAGGELGEQGPDAAVIRPEIMTPVRNTVRFVHDQQSAAGRQGGQDLVAKSRVVEAFR
jgi:hypothetical protein